MSGRRLCTSKVAMTAGREREAERRERRFLAGGHFTRARDSQAGILSHG